MSEKLPAEKKEKSHKKNAADADSRAARLQKKLASPTLLDPTRYGIEKRTLEQGNKGILPASSLHVGHWFRPDKRDTDMEIRKELITANGATPFGQMTAGPEVIEYLKDKKKQEEFVSQLTLASYMIDPKRPGKLLSFNFAY